MKNLPALIFFFLGSFYLYAQDVREAKIYVPPISGIGSAEVNSYFFRQLTYEVISQSYALVRLKSSSDYTLTGTVRPFACLHDPLTICPVHPSHTHSAQGNNTEFIFHLELTKTATNEFIGGQYIVFSRIDTRMNNMISVIVYNMLSSIPDIIIEEDPRSKWLFAGVYGMWMPRIYENEDESIHWLNFGLGIKAEFQFLNFMAIGFGLQFSQDWILISKETNEEYHDLILEIPIAFKLVFKPSTSFFLEPYTGIAYNFSTTQTTVPSSHSWFVGLDFGIKAGPGFVTIDPRYAIDLFSSYLGTAAATELEYRRYMIQIAIGYKFGFFQKNKIKDY